MRQTSKLFAIAAFSSALAFASVARADAAADVILARQLANEGIELAKRDDCDGAVKKLERAESLHHAPTILLKMGECQMKLGRFVDALSSLDRVARENLGPTPPRAFIAAQERATTLIAEVKAKLATLRVDTTGSRGGVTFQLDGRELKEAALGLDRAVDPGRHTIEAVTSDGKHVRREVELKPGSNEVVTLELPKESPAPKAATAETGNAMSTDEAKSNGSRRTLEWGLVGGGAAAVIAGGVFAALTLSKKSDLDAACSDKACPPVARDDYDSARTMATVSGIALGVGVVAIGTGLTLMFTRTRPSDRTTATWLDVASGVRF
jgi:tetratricopeptide (TPR) repeat protein